MSWVSPHKTHLVWDSLALTGCPNSDTHVKLWYVGVGWPGKYCTTQRKGWEVGADLVLYYMISQARLGKFLGGQDDMKAGGMGTGVYMKLSQSGSFLPEEQKCCGERLKRVCQ